ncbi:MAG: 2-hydroxychromene-2-carboxylate isomerase [Hyphomicrobiales bacterium]|nr:2-hydroxychromene-2-carboxylate isomerase [Hyphomicrobiales bacterium]
MKRLEFWYDFASTYSYLSAMRIEAMAAERGVEVVWRPFLLGPIFQSQGWTTSPFNLYPAKGAYMARDMERLCAARGLGFRLPDPFPQNSLYAARLGLIAAEDGWAPAFTRAVYTAEFAGGVTISDKAALAGIVSSLGRDADDLMQRIETPEVKARLKAQGEAAAERKLFGAPSFITAAGELFWGDDRLEQALDW